MKGQLQFLFIILIVVAVVLAILYFTGQVDKVLG